MIKKIILISILFIFQQSLYAAVKITKTRTWNSPEHTRVVLELSGSVSYKLFQLHKPERVVVEVENTSIDISSLKNLADKGVISLVRYAKKNKKDLQLIFDLKQTAKAKSFLLKPGQGYSHRLVVDLSPLNKMVDAGKTKSKTSSTKKSLRHIRKVSIKWRDEISL